MPLSRDQERGFEFDIYNFLAELNVEVLFRIGGPFYTVIIVPEGKSAKYGLDEFSPLTGIYTTYRRNGFFGDWVKYVELDFSGAITEGKESPVVLCTEYFPTTVPQEFRARLQEFCLQMFGAEVVYEPVQE